MNLFYKPEYAKTGDVIPFYNEETKRFENYYLKNWSPDIPFEKPEHNWYRIVTDDNLTFTEEATNISGGTGCVLKVGDLYHMFYCTFDFDVDPVAQWARHATSTDLVNWTDIPEEKFGPDGVIYRMTDWRDPFVFWNEEEQKWWMLLCARENTATERNGCVALCVSDDLSNWKYEKPLYSPQMHPSAYECPDLFKMGDWYYLVYSSYTDGFQTCYRMSKSLKGPWIRPTVDSFDGRAFYAAKTASDGENRYIYGWNPTKGENNWGFDPQTDRGLDYQTWNWGGTIVVHKLVQHEDGTLGVRPVEALENAFQTERKPELKTLIGDWNIHGNAAECKSEYGYSAAISEQIPEECCIKAKIRFHGTPSRFGVGLHLTETFDFGYYLMFEPDWNRMQFRSGLRMYEHGGQMFPYAAEMERPLILEEGKEYELSIYIQDTLAVLYVNNDRAFGFRMYNWKERNLGFFVADGDMDVWDVKICTE